MKIIKSSALWNYSNIAYIRKAIVTSIIISFSANASQMCSRSSTIMKLNNTGPTQVEMMKGLRSGEYFMQVPDTHILRTNDTGKCSLFYGSNGFRVQEGSCSYNIDKSDLDPELRQLDSITMLRYLGVGKIKLSKMSDGSYMCRHHIDGKGGGATGFWIGALAGKILTHVVVYSVAGVIGVVAAPFVGVTVGIAITGGIIAGSAPATEFASIVIGSTVGMATAVATGPV